MSNYNISFKEQLKWTLRGLGLMVCIAGAHSGGGWAVFAAFTTFVIGLDVGIDVARVFMNSR